MKSRLAATLLLLSAAASAAELSARRYAIPGAKALRLDMPDAWREEIARPSPELPPTVRITNDDRSLKVMLTPLPPRRKTPVTTAELEKLTRERGEALAPTSVEGKLTLKKLKGRGIEGWYYSFEDSAPKPGEYLYMTQGNARVGTLLLAFTILSQDREGADHAAALRMVRSARQ